MKILWLFNHPAPYKVEFFNRLGKDHDLTVIYERYAEGGRNQAFYSNKTQSYTAIYLHSLKLGGVNNLSFKVLHYLRRHNDYDLVVLNGWRTATERIALSYCKRHHVPYVFYINGGIVKKNENNLAYLAKSHYISGATYYLAPDPCSKEYLLHYGAKEERIHLYPYGSLSEEECLNAPYEKEAVAKLRKKLHIVGEKVFVSAGFFVKRKNVESLIEAWTKVPSSYSLYLIGEGPTKKSCIALAKKLKLDNVFFLPYAKHDALFRFYRACDGFLFPTHEDIYGHVVAEAMSQGLPVYASDNANAAKLLIKPRENGMILDFANQEEVAMALTLDLGEKAKQNAIDTAKGYTYEASAKAHEALFSTFLKEIQDQ